MTLTARMLGRVDYEPTYAAMQAFTQKRGTQASSNGADELWICEHPPVFTQGLAGKPEHLHAPQPIPVVQTDRGGQVTYHGPGQVVAYPLMDLQRAGYFVKEYVYRIEEALIRTLDHFGVTGHRVAHAPGIYVRPHDPASHALLPQRPMKTHTDGKTTEPDFTGLAKIAALGLKVTRHCSYHGLALNVAMDLEPFSRINPCGYARLQTVDLHSLGVEVSWDDAAQVLTAKLQSYLTR